jgi:three-Cys-motif partner protein
MTDDFFDETKEQSVVKATIIEKYFDTWAQIMTATQKKTGLGNKIGYVDLFAGPGRYKSGAVSTPLRVLQKAIEKDVYAERLLTIFNDKDSENASTLKKEIAALPGIEKLKYAPNVWNEEVGSNIATQFESLKLIPILAFIDPWGYKGLTLRLVQAFLKDWGCDCVFFFNYARINAGINNDKVREHMNALFGEERATALRAEMEGMLPNEREATIVEKLTEALKEASGGGERFVLPFCFKSAAGTRTKHHLILVTKHFKGYEVMKDIMAKSSSSTEQGVPTFTYSPADSKKQPLLFELNRPLDELRSMLLKAFSGQTIQMVDIYRKHSVGRRYIRKNYKDILTVLENDGAVTTMGRKSTRGFADDIVVKFPKR